MYATVLKLYYRKIGFVTQGPVGNPGFGTYWTDSSYSGNGNITGFRGWWVLLADMDILE